MKADSSYSTVYRIMHWAIAFCFMFLLLTIFLRLGWMNKNHMAVIMGDYLSENGVSLSEDQLVDMAKKVRKPMWIWHTYIGYVFVVLYSIRLLLPFFGEMKIRSPFTSGLSLKDKFRYWTYILFHILVVVSLVTGLLIVWGPDSLHEMAEEIHVLSLYYLLTFITLHFGGVLLAEFGNEKGIISRIIR
jgi:cytochrome b561